MGLPMIESKALQKRVRAVYRRLGLPLRTAYNKDKVYAEMLHDKKAQGDVYKRQHPRSIIIYFAPSGAAGISPPWPSPWPLRRQGSSARRRHGPVRR